LGGLRAWQVLRMLGPLSTTLVHHTILSACVCVCVCVCVPSGSLPRILRPTGAVSALTSIVQKSKWKPQNTLL
jgi:hypothetical protein